MRGSDELGAHVSSAGGTPNAPARGAELDATVIQLFTKQPNRWAEREIDVSEASAFRRACDDHGIRLTASHDSYLINLASPNEVLFRRSLESFQAELRRAEMLRLNYLVTHPGNATDGDTDRGIRQNAEAIVAALDAVVGSTRVLLEGTAGTGTALGSTFEELARLLAPVLDRHPHRVGVCLDTCHLWAVGHDLHHLDDLLDHFDRVVGLVHLQFLHLNDSVMPRGSRRDRHAGIGEGTMGDAVFHGLLNHAALRDVPKVIETPKGSDPLAADRANLGRLRGYRAGKKA
jgi:deoxyribonuclease IV